MMFDLNLFTLLIAIIIFSFGSSYTPPVIETKGVPGETCEIETGVLGICKLYRTCQNQGGIINKEKINLCASHKGRNYICCRRPFQIARDLCNAWKYYWRDDDGKCIKKTPLLTSGRNAKAGMFPEISVIGILWKNKPPHWICGGTLISPHFILTAAHCVFRIEKYVVRLGEHNLYSHNDEKKLSRVLGPIPKGLYGEMDIHYDIRKDAPIEQTIKVKKVMVHKEYNHRYQLHDIALLLLEKPAVITARVMPACLPTNPDENFKKLMLTVAGWGMRPHRKSKLQPTLQKIEVPIIRSVYCAEWLKRLNRFLIQNGLRNTHLCGGDHENSVCNGDSGGPLVLQVNESANTIPCEHTIAGIVSFAEGCSKPNVYTRVSAYLNWITSYIAPKLIPLNLPTNQCNNEGENYIRFSGFG